MTITKLSHCTELINAFWHSWETLLKFRGERLIQYLPTLGFQEKVWWAYLDCDAVLNDWTHAFLDFTCILFLLHFGGMLKKNHIILLRVQKCWKCIVDTVVYIYLLLPIRMSQDGIFLGMSKLNKIIYHAYNKRWEELGVIFHAGKYCCHIVKSVLKIPIKYWLWLSARFWIDQ